MRNIAFLKTCFTLVEAAPFEVIRSELEAVFAETRRAAGIAFQFVREDREAHPNSHTFYMSYEGPLPASAAPKEVKVNITIRERLVYSLVNQPVLRGYEEYDDLPQGAEVLAYSLDEIAAEKIVALMDRVRNEPRDLYDVWYLMSGDHINLGNLIGAVEQKWSFRGKRLEDVRDEFRNKESRLRRLWEPRLSAQMSVLPEFESVYRAVARALRQSGLTGRSSEQPRG